MKEKKPNGVQLLLRAIVRDPNGKILSDTGQNPSKSFVIQFLEFFYALFRGENTSATAEDGVEHPIYTGALNFDVHLHIDAPVNDSDYGIVVGTGDTGETNTDHKLETQLTEGVGAGEITHGEESVGTAGVVGANVDLETNRSFSNNTGSLITVKEVGIYTDFSATYQFCIIRDILGVPIEIPDMCSLTVYYTLRTVV